MRRTQSRLYELYQREWPRTVGLAGLLGAADPEDIAQDAFVRLHGKLAGLATDDEAVAYLRTIVVNLTRSVFARQAMRIRVLTGRGSWLTITPEVDSAEDGMLAGLAPDRFDALLRRLTTRQREALILRYWLDLSLADTASTMNIPLSTAKSHVARGLAALRAELAPSAEDD